MSEIDNLRKKMEEVTIELIKLLKIRTDIAIEIGDVKRNIGKNVTDENREDDLRKKIVSLSREINLDEKIATRFLNFLFNESVQVQSSTKSTHLSIFLKAKSLEQEGKKIIHMEVGEPDFLPPINVKESLSEVYDKGFLKYGQTRGMPEFREKLAQYVSKKFSTSVSEKNIFVTPGARFGVFAAISTLLIPGDEVIVIEPSWPAYKDCAFNSGIKVRLVKTSLESNWEPSILEIKEKINSNTKMIILNYPNNPTGKILPQELLNEIVNIARKNDLYILSDEIYSEYSNESWKSILEFNYEKSIVTQSFSKSHAMTGFRIGYVISDEEIINKLTKLGGLCLTNVSEPIQYVAMNALVADVRENQKIIKKRLDLINQKATEMGLDIIPSDGAMYLFARINQDDFDGTKFANFALEKGLAIAPGEGFGEYRSFIRISACQDEKTLNEGMNLLKELLENFK